MSLSLLHAEHDIARFIYANLGVMLADIIDELFGGARGCACTILGVVPTGSHLPTHYFHALTIDTLEAMSEAFKHLFHPFVAFLL